MTNSTRDRYEAKYKRVYEAGVPMVSTRGYDENYRVFLSGRKNRGQLVEFGCGEGHAAAMAAGLGYDVLGIDIAPSAIAKARQLYDEVTPGRHLRFEVGDVVESASLPPESFDVVTNIGCLHVMEEAEDAHRHVASAYRVLKPGGVAYFQNMVPPEEAVSWFPALREEIELWQRRITSSGSTKVERYQVDGRQISVEVPSRLGNTHRDVRTQVSLLASAGFRIDHVVVHTPGVNSPFEAIITAQKKTGISHGERCNVEVTVGSLRKERSR